MGEKFSDLLVRIQRLIAVQFAAENKAAKQTQATGHSSVFYEQGYVLQAATEQGQLSVRGARCRFDHCDEQVCLDVHVGAVPVSKNSSCFFTASLGDLTRLDLGSIGLDVKYGDRWSDLMQQAATLGFSLEECMRVDRESILCVKKWAVALLCSTEAARRRCKRVNLLMSRRKGGQNFSTGFWRVNPSSIQRCSWSWSSSYNSMRMKKTILLSGRNQ
jgi:hypothetical protein